MADEMTCAECFSKHISPDRWSIGNNSIFNERRDIESNTEACEKCKCFLIRLLYMLPLALTPDTH